VPEGCFCMSRIILGGVVFAASIFARHMCLRALLVA
jgi:hypothetical protein